MEKYLNRDDLAQLTQELVSSIKDFSEKLPEDEVYELRKLLSNSVVRLPDFVDEAIHLTGKLSIIRGMIKLNSNLDECRNYLTMVEKLKFAKTTEILSKVNEFSLIVNNTLTSTI